MISLRPSESKRWTTCTKSPHLIQQHIVAGDIPDDSSFYANEGTTAHALCAVKLGKPEESVGNYDKTLISDEMLQHVQDYCDVANSITDSVKDDSEQFVEHLMPLFYDKSLNHGTVDFAVVDYSKKVLHILDLKYGAGVYVSAKNNTQLVIYGISMLEDLQELGFIGNEAGWSLSLNIYQPRYRENKTKEDALKTWELDSALVQTWKKLIQQKQVDITTKPYKELTFSPSTEDEGACRFCQVKPFCSAYAELLLDGTPLSNVLTEKKPIKLLEPKNLTTKVHKKILDNKKEIVKWLNRIEEHVYESMLEGNTFEGYKLIEAYENTSWKDIDEAEQFLTADVLPDDLIYKKTIVTPTQAKANIKSLCGDNKEVAKKLLTELDAHTQRRKKDNPSLVPESKKGEDWKPVEAKNEFAEMDLI